MTAPAARPVGTVAVAPTSDSAAEVETVLDELTAGMLRAAEPDASAVDGWRVNTQVKLAILEAFRDRTTATWAAGPLVFRDRAVLPPIDPGRDRRIVPGGSAIRRGAHLEPGVVVMPPSYVNVGAWVGAGSMVDSHVLVGSCAQIGERVHLAAGVTIGGVLEPAGARPVIVEDDVFVGAGTRLLDGVLVRRGAVIGAGVVLMGTSRVFDLVREREIVGSPDRPLIVPAGAIVVPGTRPLPGEWARSLGLTIATPMIVKDRDLATDARVALEAALR